MKKHLQRWGALYLLGGLFGGSWLGQALTQLGQLSETGPEFWAATFENWQSEFLQLGVQVGILAGLAHKMLRSSKDEYLDLKTEIEDVKNVLRKSEQV